MAESNSTGGSSCLSTSSRKSLHNNITSKTRGLETPSTSRSSQLHETLEPIGSSGEVRSTIDGHVNNYLSIDQLRQKAAAEEDIPKRWNQSLDGNTDSNGSHSWNNSSTLDRRRSARRIKPVDHGSDMISLDDDDATESILNAAAQSRGEGLAQVFKRRLLDDSDERFSDEAEWNCGDCVDLSNVGTSRLKKPRRSDFGTAKKKVKSDTTVTASAVATPAVEEPPGTAAVAILQGSAEDNSDHFCWHCHKEGKVICCMACPRVYHLRCVGIAAEPADDWLCRECEAILLAESAQNNQVEEGGGTRCKVPPSRRIFKPCELAPFLRSVLNRMREVPGSKPFHRPVDAQLVTDYFDYVVHPLDISTLERHIKKQKLYASTEAFFAEVRWLLHNCVIYNGLHSPLTSVARAMMRVCKQELAELKRCPDCYRATLSSTPTISNGSNSENCEWFAALCQPVHPIVWAQLDAWPLWPAKVVREARNQVDVHFFGAHDRAWLPHRCVYLLCADDLQSKNWPDVNSPAASDKKEFPLALREFKRHLELLQERYGDLNLPPVRRTYNAELAASMFGKLDEVYRLPSASVESDVLSEPRAYAARPISDTRTRLVVSTNAAAVQSATVQSAAMPAALKECDELLEPAEPLEPPSMSALPVRTGAVTTSAADDRALLTQPPCQMMEETLPSFSSAIVASQAAPQITAGLDNGITDCSVSTSITCTSSSSQASSLEFTQTLLQEALDVIKQDLMTRVTSLVEDTCRNVSQYLVEKMPNVLKQCAGDDGAAVAEAIQPIVNESSRDDKASKQALIAEQLNTVQAQLLLERSVLSHRLELLQERHINDLTLLETREAHELEKNKLLVDFARYFEQETRRCVDETKSKQWCAFCRKEAYFYCCWNTSYCDQSCQQKHWPMHMVTCAQTNRVPGASTGSATALNTSSAMHGSNCSVQSMPLLPPYPSIGLSSSAITHHVPAANDNINGFCANNIVPSGTNSAFPLGLH